MGEREVREREQDLEERERKGDSGERQACERKQVKSSLVGGSEETRLVSFLSPSRAHQRTLSLFLRGGGLGSSTIFKKFNEPYAPS